MCNKDLITTRVAISFDVVADDGANVCRADFRSFDEFFHRFEVNFHGRLAEDVLVGEDGDNVEEKQTSFNKLNAELTVKFFFDIHQLQREFEGNTGVVELDGVSVRDQRVQHHFSHVETNLIQRAKSFHCGQVRFKHLIHRDWPVFLRLLSQKREKCFHRLVLVNFVAIETFQEVILAVIFVLVIGYDFVGVEKSLVAKTAEN